MQNNNMYTQTSVCVIGGGAAGMMAAGTALQYGASVTIFESMPFLGKKLGITGNESFMDYLRNQVVKAEVISDDGVISSCPNGGHYISIKVNGKKVWFNSVTYEIFM